MRHPLSGRGALLADLGVGMGGALGGRPRRARIDALGLRRFPAAGVLVDLDCVNRVGYVRGRGIARLEDLLTYSGRAGGTVVDRLGTIVAASGLPYDHDPVSLEGLGLLLEAQGTNLIPASGDPYSWSKLNSSSSLDNQVVAPDGTLSGDYIVSDSGFTGYLTRPYTGFTAGTAYTVSCFFKAGGKTSRVLLAQGALFSDGLARSAFFNLSAGAVTSTSGAGASGQVQNCGNGWYRCSLTFTVEVTGSNSIQFRDSSVGNGVDGVYMWGAQLEVGTVATGYIPTGAAAVTRTADSATLSLAGLWRDDLPVVLYSEADVYDVSTSRVALCVNDGSASNRHQTGHAPSPFGVVAVGGVQVLNATAGSATARVLSRACLSVMTDDGRVAGDGTLGTRDTSVAMPTGITTLRLGGITATNGTLGGHVRRAIVWQPPGNRFPDALIQERTRP